MVSKLTLGQSARVKQSSVWPDNGDSYRLVQCGPLEPIKIRWVCIDLKLE